MKPKLLKHQRAYLRKAKGRPGFANHSEQGTGKTRALIDEAILLHKQGLIQRVLVVAPKGVDANWVKIEVPKHTSPGQVESILIRSSMGVRTKARLKGLEGREKGLVLAAVNYDSLLSKPLLKELVRFLKSGPSMIIADESKQISNPKAKRTQAMLFLAGFANFRRTATGTPADNPLHLWSQMQFLDPGILDSPSFVNFRSEHCVMLSEKDGLVKWIIEKKVKGLMLKGFAEHIARRIASSRIPPMIAKNADGSAKYRNLDRLRGKIEPFSFRVTKKECLDLPDKIYTKRIVELSSTQRRLYNDLVQELRIFWQTEVHAVDRLSSLIRLQQLLSGRLTLDATAKRFEDLKENPRLEALRGELEELGEQQAIIVCRFRYEIDQIASTCEDLGITFAVYDGRLAAALRSVKIAEFQSEKVRVLIVQEQAAIGWTGTAASMVYYYSNTFSYDQRYQSEDRAHRIGQEKKVTYVDFVTLGSLDEKILLVLESKKNVADILTGDNKSLGSPAGFFLTEIEGE